MYLRLPELNNLIWAKKALPRQPKPERAGLCAQYCAPSSVNTMRTIYYFHALLCVKSACPARVFTLLFTLLNSSFEFAVDAAQQSPTPP